MKKNFTIMKKIYNSPVIEVLDIETVNLLALSLQEEVVNERGYSEKQKGDEYRSDWDNIWEGM